MAERYEPAEIEAKWQKVWEEEGTWEVSNEDAADPNSVYVLEMLPYPSGEPHIGHLKNYSIGDAVAQYRRRNGACVLHPMGYDAFGLPAENHAIRSGRHPRETTEESINEFREQLRRWGVSIDWTREFGTHEPRYYRWTQWLFLKLFEEGLAYRKEAAVKWCPKDETVLANEQAQGGVCERCGTPVEVRQLEQWMFKITDYADRLLDDLDTIEWPEHVVSMQRNWIGRSNGAEVTFRCEALGIDYPVFTTRPDTLFGATFFVMAPEHPDVFRLNDSPEVHAYVNKALTENAQERGSEDKEKTGVPLGRTVTNPVNGEEIPMYVADYVLMEYGTGAIMAVPGHDERDHAFAEKFGIEIRRVIDDPEGEGDLPYTGDGPMVNSGSFDGQHNREAYDAIVAWLESEGKGEPTVNYRLRDWLLSRQRYWGCPIPVVHCEKDGLVPVPEDQLPVELPDIEDYAPKGKSPLAAAIDWVNTTCPKCGGPALRETDTMDTFVDSSWYFLRYCDALNEERPFDRAIVDGWMPVAQYIGGVEHAILHLMYARFWTKAFADMGLVGFQEPFAKLFTQGMITRDGAKMSKSRGNVVSPRDYVDKYGADTARAYILFMGPPEQGADWQDEGVGGVNRFLARLWRICDEIADGDAAPTADATPVLRKAHWAIDKVTRDMERFAFNTAVAAVMELVNECYAYRDDPNLAFGVATAASLIYPAAPHLACEVYERMTGTRLWEEAWPSADPSLLVGDQVEVVVQVNGKVRDRLAVAPDTPKDELERLAHASDKVQAHLNGHDIVKTIVIPGKLVNVVIK
jgi:leucyl-tRNA synthetase